ncbi:hypothetical protein VTN31DRAFT_6097 [Thermomyces dupontii]|uniref:uncharacterized protein n=1 Tax=Talaromyces thermophilus TaxID=28565 RepID=UPI003743B0E9
MAVLRTLRRPRPLNSISAALAPRCNHHSPAAAANVASDSTPKTQPSQTESPIDPRWLTLIKRRIGKCLMFGLKPPQVLEAGRILQRIARDWRELVAGSQGFLTQETRRGVFRQNVAWGDMDSMVCTSPVEAWL